MTMSGGISEAEAARRRKKAWEQMKKKAEEGKPEDAGADASSEG